MSLTRRSFLQAVTAASFSQALASNAGQLSWRKILDGPYAVSFGMSSNGQSADPASLYCRDMPGGAPLSFDVSNNQILCSLDAAGVLDRICINTGVRWLKPEALKGGVFTEKLLLRAGPVRFGIEIDSGTSSDAARAVEVKLLGNLFPVFESTKNTVRVEQLVFAPVDMRNEEQAPRAIMVVFAIRNTGDRTVDGHLQTALPADKDNAFTKTVALTATKFSIAPGHEMTIEVALLLEENAERLKALEARLRLKTPLQWFTETLNNHSSRHGNLEIPTAPFYAEALTRFSENCRQSLLRVGDGSFGGGFLGSDVDRRSFNWHKDTYYNSLAMSMFAPDLCASAIPFYLRWNLPSQPIARGLARFPNAKPVTQSIGIAVAPLALAASYYRFTGDKQYFDQCPEFYTKANKILNDILATRHGDRFLFPSMFVSDGDARGQFHTGSNLIAWYAFQGMARLARDVFKDEQKHGEWSDVATKMRADLLRYCVGNGPQGKQYFEGVFEDATYVPGHDGEESDTNLMPLYGFADVDDPALLRHAQLAFSPSNPYYAEAIDAIWWHNHGGFRPATAPAWMTALAGAESMAQVHSRLHRIRKLTDADGSLWWWPYRYGEIDESAVVRGNGANKCGWASSIYLLRFVHDILGLNIDVPDRKLRFRPFSPWPQFSWKKCRLGRGEFDVSYSHDSGQPSASVMNRNEKAYSVEIELFVPAGPSLTTVNKINGRRPTEGYRRQRYGRDTVVIEQEVAPGESLHFKFA